MQTPDTRNITLFRGITRIDAHVSGAKTGYVDIGESDKLDLVQPDLQEIEQFTSRDRTGAKVKGKITKFVPKFEISGQEMDVFNLAMQTLGLQDQYEQTAGTTDDQPLADAVALGRSYFIGKRNLTSVDDVKQGGPALTAGVDYVVDLARGSIYFPITSGAAEGVAATVSYTWPNAILRRVRGGMDLQKEVSVFFAGATAEEGEEDEIVYDLEIFRGLIKPSGALSFINPPGGSEFSRWSISGDVLSDAIGAFGGAPTNPYFQLLEIPVGS